MPTFVNVYDFAHAARSKLPQMVYDYYASGANDEITLKENHAAYDRIQLIYRVLMGLSERNMQTSLLGHNLALPLLIAPMGFQKLGHKDGELGMVKAAGQAGTIMILSTAATTPMEEVVAAATGPVWFQLYMYQDREVTKALVQRAEAAGCSAIVLTVDTPVLGKREADVRNKFTLPPNLKLGNFTAVSNTTDPSAVPTIDGSGLAAYTKNMFKFDLSWKDVEWLKANTPLPLLIKGVCHPADARLALNHGVDGLIVSNHGGRQLDTAPATIEMLPSIVNAVKGQLPVLIDGGIRRGTDILKAIALGADAVCVGRPFLWGLCVNGTAGVTQVFNILRDELDTAMALCGAPTIAEITADFIR